MARPADAVCQLRATVNHKIVIAAPWPCNGKRKKEKVLQFLKEKKKSFLLNGPLPVPGRQIKDKDSIALAQQKKISEILSCLCTKSSDDMLGIPLLLTGAS